MNTDVMPKLRVAAIEYVTGYVTVTFFEFLCKQIYNIYIYIYIYMCILLLLLLGVVGGGGGGTWTHIGQLLI